VLVGRLRRWWKADNDARSAGVYRQGPSRRGERIQMIMDTAVFRGEGVRCSEEKGKDVQQRKCAMATAPCPRLDAFASIQARTDALVEDEWK
jgi:hypothetical protein